MMELLTEILENPIYRHVVTNHLPVTGLFVAWIVLAVGTVSRQKPTAVLGLLLVALMAGSTAVVMPAGEDAYPIVYETLDGPGRERLDAHADLAGTWGLALYANAALAFLAAVLAGRGRLPIGFGAGAVAMTTLATLAAAAWIAEAGGRIRHPDFRGHAKAVASADVRGGPVAMRRLTAEQYRAAVRRTFGDDVDAVGRFELESRREGLLAVGTSQVTVTPTGFEQYEALATGVVEQVLAPERRTRIVPCEPADAAAADDSCVGQVVRKVGAGLFRRPLRDEEVAARVAAAGAAAAEMESFDAGLELALRSLLVAPEFLFRVERTAPLAEEGLALRPESLAARLSYFLWNDGPDEALLQATGSAWSAEGVAADVWGAEVERLLAEPAVHAGMRAFFADLFRFDELAQVGKDPVRYPIFSGQLVADAQEQTLRVIIDHLLIRNEDYRDLFTTRRFAMSRALGPLYGVPVRAPDGWEDFVFSEEHPRAGLLSHASLHMLHSHPGRSSPTLRGLFLREALLCQEVPPAPADVEFALFNDDQNPEHRTARDRLLAHSTKASCRSCHQVTDPIGLGLEVFDGIGKYRTKENGAPIDLHGELDGVSFADVAGLGRAFRQNPRLGPCLVENLYRYAVGRRVTEAEQGLMKSLAERFEASGYQLRALLRDIATSEAFRTASPAEMPLVEARVSVPEGEGSS